jgi:hypothetical protein
LPRPSTPITKIELFADFTSYAMRRPSGDQAKLGME